MTLVIEQMQNCIFQPVLVLMLSILKDILYIVKY